MCSSGEILDHSLRIDKGKIIIFVYTKNIIPENFQIMHSYSEISPMSFAYFISEHYGWYIKTSESITFKFSDSSELKKTGAVAKTIITISF